MRKIVEQTIKQHGLIHPNDRVLVGVSGGADSVALLYVLHFLQRDLKFTLAVAHLNHAIRGSESDADEQFVKQLCWRLNLLFFSEKIDVPARVRSTALSLEMAARQIRFDFFKRTADHIGAHRLALAHNADDQAETLILRLCRGTGPQGLGGIPYFNERQGVTIVRPLRDVTHAQAVTFLKSHRLIWREDQSNTDVRFLRNRVRHEILPLLEDRLNPKIRPALGRMADIMRDENQFLDAKADEVYLQCQVTHHPRQLNLSVLMQHHIALRRRVLQMWLYAQMPCPFALTLAHMELLDHVAGDMSGTQRMHLTGEWGVVRRYDRLFLEKQTSQQNSFDIQLSIPGESIIPGIRLRITTHLQKELKKDHGRGIGVYPCFVCINANRVGHKPLSMRPWCPGDTFQPFGMKGTRKIQDIFVDAKVPRDQREKIPLLVCDNQVIWVPGYQVAKGWELPKKKWPAIVVRVDLFG